MQTKATCGHKSDDNGLTCIFFAQCPGNSDLDLWKAIYNIALGDTGDTETARRAAESYMAGRIGALPTWLHG